MRRTQPRVAALPQRRPSAAYEPTVGRLQVTPPACWSRNAPRRVGLLGAVL